MKANKKKCITTATHHSAQEFVRESLVVSRDVSKAFSSGNKCKINLSKGTQSVC